MSASSSVCPINLRLPLLLYFSQNPKESHSDMVFSHLDTAGGMWSRITSRVLASCFFTSFPRLPTPHAEILSTSPLHPNSIALFGSPNLGANFFAWQSKLKHIYSNWFKKSKIVVRIWDSLRESRPGSTIRLLRNRTLGCYLPVHSVSPPWGCVVCGVCDYRSGLCLLICSMGSRADHLEALTLLSYGLIRKCWLLKGRLLSNEHILGQQSVLIVFI